MSMNTQRILELLGTTSEEKLSTLRREERFPVSGETSANEMLNADLFGTGVQRRQAGQVVAVKRSAKEEMKKVPVKMPTDVKSRKASEGCSGANCLKRRKRANEDFEGEEIPAAPEEVVALDLVDAEGNAVGFFEYVPELVPAEIADSVVAAVDETPYEFEPAEVPEWDEGEEFSEPAIDVPAETPIEDPEVEVTEAAVAESAKKRAYKECGTHRIPSQECNTAKECKSAKAPLARGPKIMKKPAQATEMMIETGDGKFPKNFDFDEKAFAEEYGLDEKSITGIYIAEDAEAQIPEHVEVSFPYEDSVVVLSIYADNTVEETVDAQKVEPQFAAEFTKVENKEGEEKDVLILTLIDEEEVEGGAAIKSEGDELTKSEGDEDHVNEDGDSTTDEFIEEHGLDLDPYYAKQHKMKVADKGVHDVYNAKASRESVTRTAVRKVPASPEATRAKVATKKATTESLAARVIRNGRK